MDPSWLSKRRQESPQARRRMVLSCALRQWVVNIAFIVTLPVLDCLNLVQHLQPRCLEDRFLPQQTKTKGTATAQVTSAHRFPPWRFPSSRKNNQLFLDFSQLLYEEEHQIKPLPLRHFLVVLSCLAVRCCTRSRETQDSSTVGSTWTLR